MNKILMSILFSATVSVHAGECECRSKNVVADVGETVCLLTAQGWRIARCEKILNNTSWAFLPGRCSEQTTYLPEDNNSAPNSVKVTAK